MASMRNVNSTRFRRSGIRKTFPTASKSFPIGSLSSLAAWLLCRCGSCSDDGRLAAGLLDLFHSRLREDVRFHLDGSRDLARGEHLQSVAQLVNDPQFNQTVHVEHVARELFQIFQVDDRVLLLENVGEAALRQTAMQRHLAAFESAHDAVAGNRPRALVSPRRRLATARTHAASDPLFPVLLTGWWFE